MTPYHPAVVHLPVALILVSFAFDVLSRLLDKPALRNAGWYALLGGLFGAVLSVPLGLWDMERFHHTLSEGVEGDIHRHMLVGYGVLAGAFLLTLLRWFRYRRPHRQLGGAYLLFSLLLCGLTLWQGWLGGELVFEHGVGVSAGTAVAHEADE